MASLRPMVRVAESKTKTSRVKVSWSSSCLPHCGTPGLLTQRRREVDVYSHTLTSLLAI